MKIRTRLAVWYTLALLIALGLITATVYYEIFIEHPAVDIDWRLKAIGESPEEELAEALLFAGLPVAILALVGGWFLMRHALLPITRLTEALERIQADDLRSQLPRNGSGDELDRLTEVFNAMTARLDSSFQRVREFTLHASHELKTPLTIMRGEMETALREERLSAAERMRISSQLEEVQRLTQIVEGLNFLAKTDAGLLHFEKVDVRLDELVTEACVDARVLAEPQSVTLDIGLFPPVLVTGDRRRLRQLLLILTDNAIKYNHPDGTVVIRLLAENDWARLTIANSGPGISPETLERVFDRFFRGDASHNHEVEGCGLGLSIARGIVEAHNGNIQITSPPGKKTEVTVVLPATHAQLPESVLSQKDESRAVITVK